MTTALHITTGNTTGGAAHLTAVGEIDISNVAEFSDRLDEVVTAGERLVVDLTQVEYLDSAALAALFSHADHIDIHISPLNESLLTICGLTDVTTVRVIPSSFLDE